VAKFEIESGERVIERLRVANTRDAHAACQLILTDRRIVLTALDTKPGFAQMFGLLGALFDRRAAKVSHQIQRDKLGDIEVTGKRDLKVSSSGEGYARQWFEISIKNPQLLADHIERWRAGDDSASSGIASSSVLSTKSKSFDRG
jgi:hypothetical protein